ncbi:MAG: 23S rRNA (adenine(2503)-C(2))-methyltransferase RlmN, partial [Planctomycetota bacterium]
MPHLLDNVDERLDAFAAEHKLPRYRRGQVRQWLFDKRADDWLSMSNLPKPLREQLAAELPIWSTETARHTTSDDGTEKLLLSLGKI